MSLEGKRVSYVGFERDGLALGDQGKVLSSDGSACHVMWATGDRAGQVDLLTIEDVVTPTSRTAAADVLDDSLAVAPMQTFAVRETYDNDGPAGLINALNDAGLLASFAQIAEDAAQHVSARLWQDEEFGTVLAQLDPEEGSRLVSLASVVLLRDAFGPGGDDG